MRSVIRAGAGFLRAGRKSTAIRRQPETATAPHRGQPGRASALLAVLALASLAACSGADGGDAPLPWGAGGDGGGGEVFALQQGDTVAILELAAPSVTPFTLRATVPLPAETFVPGVSVDPFRIAYREGGTAPVQVEVVSRYPKPEDGADVVEVIARVARPAGAAPGQRIRYALVWEAQPASSFSGDAQVDDLLATPGSIVLAARDVFEHEYSADLVEDLRTPDQGYPRTLRDGSQAIQRATHETLRPTPAVAGAQGTLPHFVGVHTYLTRWADEAFFSLDLRIHNAASGANDADPLDDPLGKIYFRTLELRLPQGWTLLNAIDDPFFEAPYDEGDERVWPIVAALPDGRMHVMPPMSQFHRRLAVARVGSEARARAALNEEGLAFVRDGEAANGRRFFSWWNPTTARYFPQRQRLPELDMLSAEDLREQDANRLANRLAEVASGAAGEWPAPSPGLGWAHPWGVSDAGMQGGDEIWLYDGLLTAWSASNAGYRLHALQHRKYSDRQPNALFDASGEPTTVADWIVQGPDGPYLPVWWYNSPLLWASDPFGFSSAPTFQVQAVASQGLAPSYEPSLASFEPIDEAHLIRYTHNAKVLVWLGNDALAKDDLWMQAEGFRFAFATLPQDPWGAMIPTGLLSMRTFVEEHPGEGLPFGRGEGWGLDVLNAAYSTQTPAWREEARPLFDEMIDLVADGQSTCTGIIQATPLYNVFDAQYRCRQSIEAAITENALVGMRESVYRGVSPQRVAQVDNVLNKSFAAMVSALVWDDANHGPQAMMAVGSIDQEAPPFCAYYPEDGTYGYADHYQIWSSFAYAYRISGDVTYLDRAQEALDAQDLQATLTAEVLENLANRAGLLALVQELEGSVQN